MRKLLLSLLLVAFAGTALAQQSGPDFPPFEKWRSAVLSGDASTLASLYTQSPPPDISTTDKKPVSAQDEVAFWSSWKAKGLTNLSAQVVQQNQPSPDIHTLVLQLTLTTKENGAAKKQYVAMAQNWFHQGNNWYLGIERRTAATRLRQPLENKEIYPQNVDANKEIADALQTASSSHKRVILVFGGNWCFDCHVLDDAFHSAEIAPTLNRSFVVVHVDIGQMDKNLDIAKKYEVPVENGVPALAVLDPDGKLVYSQKEHQFSAARSMAPEDILSFLNKWKPAAKATASRAS
jgi:thioredoxin 1